MSKEKRFSDIPLPMSSVDYPHFEINGAFQLLADGCIGILHYEESKVSLNCEKLVIEIEGEGLTLNRLGNNEAEVRGKIGSVKLL